MATPVFSWQGAPILTEAILSDTEDTEAGRREETEEGREVVGSEVVRVLEGEVIWQPSCTILHTSLAVFLDKQ